MVSRFCNEGGGPRLSGMIGHDNQLCEAFDTVVGVDPYGWMFLLELLLRVSSSLKLTALHIEWYTLVIWSVIPSPWVCDVLLSLSSRYKCCLPLCSVVAILELCLVDGRNNAGADSLSFVAGGSIVTSSSLKLTLLQIWWWPFLLVGLVV